MTSLVSDGPRTHMVGRTHMVLTTVVNRFVDKTVVTAILVTCVVDQRCSSGPAKMIGCTFYSITASTDEML